VKLPTETIVLERALDVTRTVWKNIRCRASFAEIPADARSAAGKGLAWCF
jgi:hypothetical protein